MLWTFGMTTSILCSLFCTGIGARSPMLCSDPLTKKPLTQHSDQLLQKDPNAHLQDSWWQISGLAIGGWFSLSTLYPTWLLAKASFEIASVTCMKAWNWSLSSCMKALKTFVLLCFLLLLSFACVHLSVLLQVMTLLGLLRRPSWACGAKTI